MKVQRACTVAHECQLMEPVKRSRWGIEPVVYYRRFDIVWQARVALKRRLRRHYLNIAVDVGERELHTLAEQIERGVGSLEFPLRNRNIVEQEQELTQTPVFFVQQQQVRN